MVIHQRGTRNVRDQYGQAINALLKFKLAMDKINPRVANRVVGNIGEYYVLQELDRCGLGPIEYKGGYGKYDIALGNPQKRIEVRTSLLKNEGLYPKGVEFYGWRVLGQKAKRESYDFLIGVTLDNSWKCPNFYIFTAQEACAVGDVKIGRFRSVRKKIHLFKDRDVFRQALACRQSILITPFERTINQQPGRFKDKWNKLK